MAHVINLRIEHLHENLYLTTNEDVQGSITLGLTIQERFEIARDVAKKLLESRTANASKLPAVGEA